VAANASSKPVIYAALIGNLLVAVTKAVAAIWTGSSAMVSEAIHSFVDTGNELLLLYGLRQAGRGADREHPLGHGRELYFWSFIVAILIFALGATVSVYQGVVHARHPEPISSPGVSYVVLALSFLFEGASWLLSLRQFRAAKGTLGFFEAFRRSKDPPSFMVLFEDSAALLGIVIAALGTLLATKLDTPVLDGVASILIGLVLGGTSVLLARESKSLLIGEQASPKLAASILHVAEEASLVSRANGVLTTQLAPDQVVAALSVALFVKPQTARTFRATAHWGGDQHGL
jgi:cation diffusion facilitator family transporter